MRVTYREATLRDVAELARSLRQEDLDEIAVTCKGQSPGWVLSSSLGHSTCAWAVVDPWGKPVCLVGVCPCVGGAGVPWLLGSDLCKTYARDILRLGKRAIPIWDRQFHTLINTIDTKNTLHVRWVKALGFEVRDEEGRFKTFIRRRLDV